MGKSWDHNFVKLKKILIDVIEIRWAQRVCIYFREGATAMALYM